MTVNRSYDDVTAFGKKYSLLETVTQRKLKEIN